MIVQRTINGTTRRYIEYLSNQFDVDEDETKADAFFIDSGLTYSSTAASSISGLDHLEGEAVSILGDGSVYTKGMFHRVLSRPSIRRLRRHRLG